MTNKFKNVNGVLLLRELFWEHADNKANAIYTLKDEDHEVDGVQYQSLYRLFMAKNDPTEYLFAMEYLDGWSHWTALSQASFFIPYVTRWREELELRFRANALVTINQIASTGSREALQAAKYILDGGYTKKSRTGAGRPSKAEIANTASEIIAERKRQEEDYLRVVK